MVKSMPFMSNNKSNIQSVGKRDLTCSIRLNSKEFVQKKQDRRNKKQQELRSLYLKLKEVIPSCQAEPLSSLDIVLHAVDYINELHQTLLKEYPGLSFPIPNLISSKLTSDSFCSSSDSMQHDSRIRYFRDVTNVSSTLTNSPENHRN